MSKKAKKLCKWKKDEYKKCFDELSEAVSEPRYVCTKCGRAARYKKWLCKPEKL